MNDLKLNPLEQHILEQSGNLNVTQRRKSIILVTGIGIIGLLVSVANINRSWKFVLSISIVYIVVTAWEKVAYANAVLGYKSLIQKLMKRVNELESNNSKM